MTTPNPHFEAGPGLAATASDLADARLLALLVKSLSTAEAAARLGVAESTVRRRIARRELAAIQRHGRWRLPAYQFSLYEDGLVEGFAAVHAALPAAWDAVAVADWFNTPNPALFIDDDGSDASPLEWLRAFFPVDDAVQAASAADR